VKHEIPIENFEFLGKSRAPLQGNGKSRRLKNEIPIENFEFLGKSRAPSTGKWQITPAEI